MATEDQAETAPLLERHRRQWRAGECVRLVQGPLGHFLADHARRADPGLHQPGPGRCIAGLPGHDDDEEDRRGRHRRGGAGRGVKKRWVNTGSGLRPESIF